MERIDLIVKLNTKKYIGSLLALVLVIGCMTIGVAAAPAPCESAVATGSYRHPGTGSIEDSGGTSSEALGQSMVTSVVSPEALLETASDGSLYLSLRFNLMSNISKTDLAVQKPGESSWTPVTYEVTATDEDSKDLRIPIPAKDVIIRAECFVDAMGRAVIFYVTVDNFTSGNTGSFAQMDADKPPVQSANSANGSGNSVIGDDVVGLVTGGSGKAPAASDSTSVKEGDAPMQEVIVTGRVWFMLFVLVFCTQLLACLTFWGIKTLICTHKTARPRKNIPPLPDEAEEDTVFSDDLWDEDWEDTEHEVR